MQLQLTCTSCSEVVGILSEDSVPFPPCPHCGHRLAVILAVDGEPIGVRPRIDDDVVSLAVAAVGLGLVRAGCGRRFNLPILWLRWHDSRGRRLSRVPGGQPAQTPPGPPTVACPNCGQAIDLRENDRGKTTICPNCKYFLGCVLPNPKHVYRKHGARR